MYKNALGISILVLLLGIVVFNFIVKDDHKPTAIVPDDLSNAENNGLTPPNQPGIDVGELAPDFILKTLAGKKVQLSELRGKKVMVNFWATWCPPCRQEMPAMQTFYDAYADDIEILAVNLTGSENSEGDVQKYIDEFQYSYPILLDKDLSVSEEYMAIAIPTTYFIGTDGIIQIPKKVGPMTYDDMVEMMNQIN